MVHPEKMSHAACACDVRVISVRYVRKLRHGYGSVIYIYIYTCVYIHIHNYVYIYIYACIYIYCAPGLFASVGWLSGTCWIEQFQGLTLASKAENVYKVISGRLGVRCY